MIAVGEEDDFLHAADGCRVAAQTSCVTEAETVFCPASARKVSGRGCACITLRMVSFRNTWPASGVRGAVVDATLAAAHAPAWHSEDAAISPSPRPPLHHPEAR